MNCERVFYSWLDEDRKEIFARPILTPDEIAEEAAEGLRIVQERGEFTPDEIAAMLPVELAGLALGVKAGSDAYSLWCARIR